MLQKNFVACTRRATGALVAREFEKTACTLLGLLGVVLLLSGCQHTAEPAPGQVSVETLEVQGVAWKTTDPGIARANLDAQIASLPRQMELSGGDLATRSRFFDLLSLRVQVYGHLSDLDTMADLAQPGETVADAGERLLFVRYLLAIHEFSVADEQLDDIEANCVGEVCAMAASTARQTLDLALHQNLETRLTEAEDAELAHPNFQTHSQVANLLSALGRFDDADAAYQRAVDSYNDVSPFSLALLSFRRGVMWSEAAGNGERGGAHYDEALRLVPDYVVANVHRAELAPADQARELLEVAVRGEDPEPWGKLSLLLREGDESRSRELLMRATAAYDELLLSYPLAFVDHGSEYFAGPGGDSARATQLAEMNLENRETPRSLLVAISAHRAAGNHRRVCQLVFRAAQLEANHPVLAAEIRAERVSCLLPERE